MKFACVVTLYYPKKEEIYNINKYKDDFDIVYIYDNTPENHKYVCDIEVANNVKYFFNGKNDGLCIPLNKSIEDCIKEKVDFLCTLDQDSIFRREDIKKIKSKLMEMMDIKLAILSPKIQYAHQREKKYHGLKKVAWTICSGSFLNVQVLKKENIRYDEYYFIDRFDRDICMQITKSGYMIYIYYESVLYQELGYIVNGKSNHSVDRHYYIFRNRFYYNHKYYKAWFRNILTIMQLVRHFYLILLNEDNKIAKIRIIKKAYIDYSRAILKK